MSDFAKNVNALIEAMERSGAATTGELFAERERHADLGLAEPDERIGGDTA